MSETKKREEWDTAALQRDFTVIAFQAPYVIVRRKSDGASGSLEFTHMPRVYFNWRPDERAQADVPTLEEM